MPTRRNRAVVGSCWECKDRRVACDLTKPECKRCQQSRRECSYDPVRLRWRDGGAHIEKTMRSRAIVRNVTPHIPDPNEAHLVYFTHELTPRLKVRSIKGDWDISALYADDAFRSVMVASSCTHQSMHLGTGTLKPSRIQSLETQQTAIAALRAKTSQDLAPVALRQLFQSSTLFCIIQGLMDPCPEGVSIRTHLIAAKSILDRLAAPSLPLTKESGLWTFFLSIYATMDLVSALLSGARPLFDASSWSDFGSCTCWWGNVPANDTFLETMGTLSQLATIGADVYQCDTPLELGALLTMQWTVQKPSTSQVHDSPNQNADPEWSTFCSIYKLSASVYLYRAIARLPMTHCLVRQAVNDALGLASQLPSASKSCILLPLLILGVNCVDDKEMRSVKELFGNTNDCLSFGAINEVLGFLEKHWVLVTDLNDCGIVESLDWWGPLADISDSVCLF